MLTGTRSALVARLTLPPACALCADWIASDTPIRSPAKIVNRISSNHAEQPEYENEHNNSSKRNGKVHIDSSGLGIRLVVGLAERGQRLVEEPPFGLDQFGLDPYVDPELSELISGLMRKLSSDALSGYPNNEDRRPKDVCLPTEPAIVNSVTEK
jgi:hypothetical protein